MKNQSSHPLVKNKIKTGVPGVAQSVNRETLDLSSGLEPMV